MGLFKWNLTIISFFALLTLVSCADATMPCSKNELTSPTSSIEQFSIDLYGQLAQQNQENFLFSPYSIVSALAMTYTGAKGETKAQMAHTLYFPLCSASENGFHQAFSELSRSLTSKRSNDYQLNVANALWGGKQLALAETFSNILQKFYGTTLKLLDFQSSEEARLIINQWVEVNTSQKIKELLSKGTIGASTQLVLTNALYFKGSWATPFKEAETKLLPFTVSPESAPITVPTMEIVDTFDYFEDSTLQAIELPYTYQSSLSMVILLPKAETSLTIAQLREWLSQVKAKLSQQVVQVLLPKFKVESAFELKDSLQALKMKDAFVLEKADFSGISNQEKLALSAVIHKTFVDVNEQGTEAAAATAVAVARGMPIPLQPSAKFHADHPFIFLIRERNSGVLLFIGRVIKPEV